MFKKIFFFCFRAVPRTLPTIMSFHQGPYLVRGGIKNKLADSHIFLFFFPLSAFRNRNGFFARCIAIAAITRLICRAMLLNCPPPTSFASHTMYVRRGIFFTRRRMASRKKRCNSNMLLRILSGTACIKPVSLLNFSALRKYSCDPLESGRRRRGQLEARRHELFSRVCEKKGTFLPTAAPQKWEEQKSSFFGFAHKEAPLIKHGRTQRRRGEVIKGPAFLPGWLVGWLGRWIFLHGRLLLLLRL